MKIKTLINQNKERFDIFYTKLLHKRFNNSHLDKAMKYGAINGGKRIRPFLVSISSGICGLTKKKCFGYI